jgi:hypothetical protein
MLTCIALGAGSSAPAQAHHSFAMFDKNKHVMLKGVVSRIEWANPHVFIIVAVPDGNGGSTEYTLECKSPNMLQRLGWKPNTLKIGDAVSASVFLLKDGRSGGLLDAVTLASGVTMKG